MKKVAFIKFGGLASGGSEKWLQTIAANLSKEKYEVSYFYCDSAPYIGSDWVHPKTDPNRKKYMEDKQVKLIEFSVKYKDVTTPTHDWVETNFWDYFNESNFDLICTVRAGHKEYPYYLIKEKPIVEFITLAGMSDDQSNILKSVHISDFQLQEWRKSGGDASKAEIVPLFTELPKTETLGNLRDKLGLQNKFVFGFHQRQDPGIASFIPIDAYKQVENENTAFVLLGGDKMYDGYAKQIGLKNFIQLPHTGNENEIHKFLNTLNLYTHGRADGETFGHVFAEALYHGLPCVSHAAKNMGHVETIGPAGIVASNMNSYVDFMNNMQNNKELYNSLSEKAKEHFAKNLSIESAMQKIDKIFNDIFSFEELKQKSPDEFWLSMY